MEEYQRGVDPVDILFGSWIKCAEKFSSGFQAGSWTGCAWAGLDVASLFAGKILAPLAKALRAVDASLVTGVGIRDTFNALRALDELDPAALNRIEKTAKISATFAHDTDHLVRIVLAGGSSITSTPGHRVHVVGLGWTHVNELHQGDRLRSPDGETHSVTALRDLTDTAPRQVYDLTVDGLHTFYVRSEGRHAADLLVHNCVNLADETRFPESQAHTLSKHVNRTAGQAVADAQENLRNNLAPISTVWTNAEIAQQAVDRVVSQYFFPNGTRRAASFEALDNFLNKRGQRRSSPGAHRRGTPSRDVFVHNCLNLVMGEGPHAATEGGS
ncbi:polymorphic toxin-type HINT domain-containing protein [Streptomyces sp. NPDC091209]|uniref:polymorphic toxin-type HINT domain-containing protein n=1 Tax=Streptomyces sp. NPDC091209 TaxID=3365974 RepID=UPI0037F9D25A